MSGLARIVRHRKRQQLQSADAKRAVAVDEVDLRQIRGVPREPLKRAVGQPERQAVVLRANLYAPAMWSLCSWVTRMPARSPGARPSRASLRSVSRTG